MASRCRNGVLSRARRTWIAVLAIALLDAAACGGSGAHEDAAPARDARGASPDASQQNADASASPDASASSDASASPDASRPDAAGGCTGGTIYFSEDFSDNLNGWTLEGEWAIGPTSISEGQQQGYPDPASDHDASAENGVAGIVLGGNYSTQVHPHHYLTSPAIDLSAAPGTVTLSYWRWLNCDMQPFVSATIEVWNGASWITLWQNSTDSLTTDSAWSRYEFDVTAHKNAGFRVRFGHQTNTQSMFLAFVMSGWNVDGLTLASEGCE
jgi:hypothetical protein